MVKGEWWRGILREKTFCMNYILHYTNINDRTCGRNASLWLIDLLSLCVFGKRRCNVYKLGVCSEDETKDDIIRKTQKHIEAYHFRVENSAKDWNCPIFGMQLIFKYLNDRTLSLEWILFLLKVLVLRHSLHWKSLNIINKWF